MITIHGRQIERALIVDDEPEARDAYEYVIEDMGIRPQQVTDRLRDDMRSFISSIETTDVILCDFHLKKHSYAPCDGDQLMASCFLAGYPGVLCTTIPDAPIRRDYLRYIPGVIRIGNLEPRELLQGWERCLLERDGCFEPARRPWRTLVRVDYVEPESRWFYAVVSSWHVRTKVLIDYDALPIEFHNLVEPGRRFHAAVNTGAESAQDLFFDSWEPE